MKRVLLPLMRIGIFAFACLHFSSEIANAQVTADDTVNTQVTQTDNVSEITGGETRGDNLFHSFQEFSVGAGNEAFFNNAEAIANIFSRVTGGDMSQIDGLISANGSANLFLINPAGITFGEGASLNIGGSFYGSTADSILFEDGEFSATNTENTPVLTINAPIGLGFRDNPNDVINQSRALNSTGQFTSGLQVLAGKSLALIGGDVRFDGGFVFAPGGRVELGGLSEAGTISFNDDGSFSFPEDVARSDISLNDASVDVASTTGGDISLTAGNITIKDSVITTTSTNNIVDFEQFSLIQITASQDSIEMDNSTIEASNLGAGLAGDISLDAPNEISVKNTTVSATGNSGRISIGNSIQPSQVNLEGKRTEAEREDGTKFFEFSNQLNTFNLNSDDFAGSIRINARDRINVVGTNIDSSVQATRLDPENPEQTNDNFSRISLSIPEKNSQGSINIKESELDTTNFSTGFAGLISLDAPNEISIKESQLFAGGNDGVIKIGSLVQPSQVNLEGERTEAKDANSSDDFSNLLSTDSSNSNDLAGRILINARSRINVIGTSIDSETETTILDRDPENQEQTNDNYSVISLRIDKENSEGSINVEESEIDSTNFSTGFAGFINLDAPSEISIKDSRIFAEGSYGVIAIGASVQPSQVTLEGQRTETEDGFEFSNLLSTKSFNPGANDLAGRIRISVSDRIDVTGTDIQNATVTTRTTDINDEEGLNFGVISLSVDAENPLGSIAVERSRINTSNSSIGFAGNVDLNAREKIEISDSSIFSTGRVGAILFGESDLSGETSSPQEIIISDTFLTVSNKDVTVPENEDPQIDAGTISINATNNVSIANNSDIRTFTERVGNAGSLTIQSENGTVSFDNSNVFSNVVVGGAGDAGDINITGNSISLTSSSQLQSRILENSETLLLSGIGNGGNITLNAKESITLSGRDQDGLPSAIFTDVEETPFGNAGNIEINTSSLSLTDGAELNTEFSGLFGNAGNITIKADFLTLDNNSSITSSSIPSEAFSKDTENAVREILAENFPEFSPEALKGGNVTINLQDVLKLSGGSVVDAQATGGSNGGNITINAPDGFIVAFPNQNNDITANAVGGAGGKINITAESVFGIEERELNDRTNDINARSGVLGLDGTVNIKTSDINPLQGTTELPSNVVEAKQTTEQACSVDRQTGTASGLTIQGRGGVQPSPDLPLNSQTILENGKNIASQSNEAQVSAIAPIHTSQGDIIPAQGIVRTEDGRILLTAYRTDGNSRLPQGSANCTSNAPLK